MCRVCVRAHVLQLVYFQVKAKPLPLLSPSSPQTCVVPSQGRQRGFFSGWEILGELTELYVLCLNAHWVTVSAAMQRCNFSSRLIKLFPLPRSRLLNFCSHRLFCHSLKCVQALQHVIFAGVGRLCSPCSALLYPGNLELHLGAVYFQRNRT